jgi:outer membrane lipoprotein LolB
VIRRRAGALLLAAVGPLGRVGPVGLLGLLGACATAPPIDAPAFSGRIAIQVAAGNNAPARQASVSFELRGDAQRGELDLSGPLGATLARARWQPGRAELIGPDGPVTFSDLDSLATQAFGEPLPLAAMFYWLRGRPWPDAAHSIVDGGFVQVGWQVDLGGFSTGLVVARRAATPAAPTTTLRVRLDSGARS